MPRYEFDNVETGEIEAHFVKISELDEFKEINSHLKQRLSKPGFADPARIGVSKNPESFNQLVKNIKNRYHGSTIETK
jgi:hypothetical protein